MAEKLETVNAVMVETKPCEPSAEATLIKSAAANDDSQRLEDTLSAGLGSSSGLLEPTEYTELGGVCGDQETDQLDELYKDLELLEMDLPSEPAMVNSLEDLERRKLEEAAALFESQFNQVPDRSYEKTLKRTGTWESMWQKRRAGVWKPSDNQAAEKSTQADREKLQSTLTQAMCALALLCGLVVATAPNARKLPSKTPPLAIVSDSKTTATSSQATRPDPKLVPSAELQAGQSHLKAKRPLSETEKTAIEEKTFISQTKQLDLTTLKKRGYQYIRLGDGHHAVLMLSQAVKRRPDDGEARKYLAYALLAANNPTDALAQYLAGQKLRRDSAIEQISFATALAESSNKEPAEAYFDKLVTNFSDDPEKLWMIEKKCESAGLLNQASNAASQAGAWHKKELQKPIGSIEISQATEN